ncbi:MAG: response regulator transcription factor [Chitinophagaceae bacterium]|nr:MAG: response regulator transcription factor [Chitinophagaceae bacterium]
MIRCIAIDDEPLALALLQDNISKVPYLQLVASCGDAFEAMKVMQDQQVDLIFADIQMPGMTGLQFIGSLQVKPMVILLTAYKQYALESYDLQVVDYLLKPVELSRFIAACNKAQELHQLRNPRQGTAAPDFMFINADYSLVRVAFSDILYIEGLKDYLKIHLKNNKKGLVTRMTFREVEEMLPPTLFVRIHKSFIISTGSITSIKKSAVFLGELELPVGETYKDIIARITGK